MEEALKIVEKIEHEFPRAARPRQLKGLVLSNLGRDQEAQQILGELVAAGHTESRILNEYARTWIDRYVSTGQENFLRTARNLRLKAFEEDPTDYFSDINAAAESILLGEIEMGKQYAERVIQGIRGRHPIDGGLDYRDYWEIATAAHAYLILRKYDQAIELYRKVVDTSPLETYSHASTLNSARRLMKPLKAPRRVVKIIELIFQHVPNELTSAWGRAAAI